MRKNTLLLTACILACSLFPGYATDDWHSIDAFCYEYTLIHRTSTIEPNTPWISRGAIKERRTHTLSRFASKTANTNFLGYSREIERYIDRNNPNRTINAQTIKWNFYVVNANGGGQGTPFKLVKTTSTTDLQNQTTWTTNTVTDALEVQMAADLHFPDGEIGDVFLENNTIKDYNYDGTSYTLVDETASALYTVVLGSEWSGPVDVRVRGTAVVTYHDGTEFVVEEDDWESGTFGTKYANDSFTISVGFPKDSVGEYTKIYGIHVVGFGTKN